MMRRNAIATPSGVVLLSGTQPRSPATYRHAIHVRQRHRRKADWWDTEAYTHVVDNTPLHARAVNFAKVTFLIVVTNGGFKLRRDAVAHIYTVSV